MQAHELPKEWITEALALPARAQRRLLEGFWWAHLTHRLTEFSGPRDAPPPAATALFRRNYAGDGRRFGPPRAAAAPPR